MKESLKEFLHNRSIIMILVIGFVINLLNLIYLLLKVKPSAEPIPLHYNIYFGIDLIGQWYKVFINPAVGFIIYFINTIISFIIYKRLKLIAYLLTSLSIFISLILIGATWLITKQII